MKCTVTGEQTNMMTKNFPLSREGRVKLENIRSKYNEKLREIYMEVVKKNGNNLTEGIIKELEKMAPQASKKAMLELLSKKTQEELFAEFDKKEEEESNETE
jgi:Skp family chaperone for outer membrane proteins